MILTKCPELQYAKYELEGAFGRLFAWQVNRTGGKVRHKLTKRSDNVERLSDLPLVRSADTTHRKLADIQDCLANCETHRKPHCT
jgi:hypothetical protein